jgi:hypothetical protein
MADCSGSLFSWGFPDVFFFSSGAISEETLASSDSGSPFFLLPGPPSSAEEFSFVFFADSLFSVTDLRGAIGDAETGGGPSRPLLLLVVFPPPLFHISALLGRYGGGGRKTLP